MAAGAEHALSGYVADGHAARLQVLAQVIDAACGAVLDLVLGFQNPHHLLHIGASADSRLSVDRQIPHHPHVDAPSGQRAHGVDAGAYPASAAFYRSTPITRRVIGQICVVVLVAQKASQAPHPPGLAALGRGIGHRPQAVLFFPANVAQIAGRDVALGITQAVFLQHVDALERHRLHLLAPSSSSVKGSLV